MYFFIFLFFFFFFFFQAEDGIRDFHVTGVQTCALPICASPGGTGPCSRAAATIHRTSPPRPVPAPRRCTWDYERTDRVPRPRDAEVDRTEPAFPCRAWRT